MKKLDYSNAIEVDDDDNPVNHEAKVASIFGEIGQNLDIESLSLKGLWLNPAQMERLADILSACKNLKILDLGYNGPQISSSISSIKKIIEEHPLLGFLSLECNRLTDKDIENLVDSNDSPILVERLKTVEINLANNQITEASLNTAKTALHPASVINIAVSNWVKNKELANKYISEAWESEQLAERIQAVSRKLDPISVKEDKEDESRSAVSPLMLSRTPSSEKPSPGNSSPEDEQVIERKRKALDDALEEFIRVAPPSRVKQTFEALNQKGIEYARNLPGWVEVSGH